METLELSFLNVLLLTHGVTQKIHKKFKQSELSADKFSKMYPSYSDLNQVMYHSAILQARRLWEANHLYNLTDQEWDKITEFRHEVSHAKKKSSQTFKVIGNLNLELIPLLNKISKAIYEKYRLDDNLKYTEYVAKYLSDIEML